MYQKTIDSLRKNSRTHLKIRFQRRDARFLKRGDAADAETYWKYVEAEPQAAAKKRASWPKWNFEMGSSTTQKSRTAGLFSWNQSGSYLFFFFIIIFPIFFFPITFNCA